MPVTHRLPARFTLAHGLMILAGLTTFVLVTTALRDRSAIVQVAYAGEASAGGIVTPQLVAISASTPGIENFARAEDLSGKVLARTIDPGQPIMTTDLIEEGRLNFRTMAIPVDRYQLDGLKLRRLDRVDVIGFDPDDRPVYLATDLIVAGTAHTGGDGFGGASEGFLTVQVDDVDALHLSLGLHHGPLHVVRSTGAGPVTRLTSPVLPSGADQAGTVEP